MRLTGVVRSRMALGYIASLGSALSYGSVTLVARKITDDYASPVVGTAFSMLFGTLIMAVLFHRHAIADAPGAPRRAWLFVALAGCSATWGVSFWFLALSRAPVVLVSPLAGTYPLVAIALTHVFLQKLEKVTWRTVVGAMFAVAGVALIAVGRG
ncbi:MAG: DMT family transporter [SAR202 cluster bacterium]|nr:DMT family transporter [SAR202 cluster bacterium]